MVQLGDVAMVAADLSLALRRYADVDVVPVSQPGARLPALLKPIAAPARLVVAARAALTVRRLRPDIVHVHWVPNALVPILARRRFLLHVHGDDVRALSWWRRPLFHWLMRRASQIVYSTPDLAAWVGGTWLPNPLTPVPGGPRDAAVLVASRPDPSKGREVAIAAAELARGRFPIRMLDGPDAPAWVDRIAEMDRSEFRVALARHAVVWGQFKLGALGLTELEAMGAGCVVMSWVSDETLAAYGGNVPVISVRSPAEIVRLTEGLLNEPERRAEIGRRAASFVRRWHDPDTIARRLVDIYRAVLDEGATRQAV